MIALHEILQHAFPIGRPDLVGHIAKDGLLEMIGPDHVLQRREPGGERGRIGGQGHEDEALPDGAGEFRQAAAAGIEIGPLADARGTEKTAGVIIGPMMIGADDALLVAAAARHHRAAMAADIGESPDHAIPPMDDHHGFIADPDGHEIAGGGHLLPPPDADPFAHEQLLAFQGEDVGIRIEGARHRAGLVIGEVCGIPQSRLKRREVAIDHIWSCPQLPARCRWRLSGRWLGRGRHGPWPSSPRP